MSAMRAVRKPSRSNTSRAASMSRARVRSPLRDRGPLCAEPVDPARPRRPSTTLLLTPSSPRRCSPLALRATAASLPEIDVELNFGSVLMDVRLSPEQRRCATRAAQAVDRLGPAPVADARRSPSGPPSSMPRCMPPAGGSCAPTSGTGAPVGVGRWRPRSWPRSSGAASPTSRSSARPSRPISGAGRGAPAGATARPSCSIAPSVSSPPAVDGSLADRGRRRRRRPGCASGCSSRADGGLGAVPWLDGACVEVDLTRPSSAVAAAGAAADVPDVGRSRPDDDALTQWLALGLALDVRRSRRRDARRGRGRDRLRRRSDVSTACRSARSRRCSTCWPTRSSRPRARRA